MQCGWQVRCSCFAGGKLVFGRAPGAPRIWVRPAPLVRSAHARLSGLMLAEGAPHGAGAGSYGCLRSRAIERRRTRCGVIRPRHARRMAPSVIMSADSLSWRRRPTALLYRWPSLNRRRRPPICSRSTRFSSRGKSQALMFGGVDPSPSSARPTAQPRCHRDRRDPMVTWLMKRLGVRRATSNPPNYLAFRAADFWHTTECRVVNHRRVCAGTRDPRAVRAERNLAGCRARQVDSGELLNLTGGEHRHDAIFGERRNPHLIGGGNDTSEPPTVAHRRRELHAIIDDASAIAEHRAHRCSIRVTGSRRQFVAAIEVTRPTTAQQPPRDSRLKIVPLGLSRSSHLRALAMPGGQVRQRIARCVQIQVHALVSRAQLTDFCQQLVPWRSASPTCCRKRAIAAPIATDAPRGADHL